MSTDTFDDIYRAEIAAARATLEQSKPFKEMQMILEALAVRERQTRERYQSSREFQKFTAAMEAAQAAYAKRQEATHG
jgi:hypothetical protein